MARKPTAAAPTSRRKFASVAALLAAFGTAGPFSGSAAAAAESEGEGLADVGDYATAEFAAWGPLPTSPLMDRTAWLEYVAGVFPVIALGMAVMQRDHHGNAKVAADAVATGADEALMEFAQGLLDAGERFAGLGEMLRSAHFRVLAGAARHLRQIGAA